MRKYEIMYIVNASLEDEKRQEVIDALHAIITNNGGKVVNVDEWGMRDFAYPIDHMLKGYYMVITIEGDNNVVSEFDRLTRINSNVVRHMIVKLED